LGNGIASVDEALIAGLDPALFSVKAFVVRADLPSGQAEVRGRTRHISLAGAYPILREELKQADVLHVNGAFDPVACNAAVAAGVPGIIEVMHQVETGGLHPGIDAVVCVSELVRSVQCTENSFVIHNGVDTERFSFKPGRRNSELINVIQVANTAKCIHCELGDITAKIAHPRLRALMVGDRKPVAELPSLGLVSDMPTVYHNADLLFLIERRYALGLVFIEGMACGTLPVVSGDSGAASFVQSGETGWVVNPPSPGEAEKILRHALEVVESPRFISMQQRAREVVIERFGLKRMLWDYSRLYEKLGRLPRKRKCSPAAWMQLAIFVKLFLHGSRREALEAFELYIADPRPLEPYFLRHPMGQATLSVVLGKVCPDLIATGHKPLVSALCARLRGSRCISPALDELERFCQG
jgi:glycosyltransferase involved in cell wall biosynthesis